MAECIERDMVIEVAYKIIRNSLHIPNEAKGAEFLEAENAIKVIPAVNVRPVVSEKMYNEYKDTISMIRSLANGKGGSNVNMPMLLNDLANIIEDISLQYDSIAKSLNQAGEIIHKREAE